MNSLGIHTATKPEVRYCVTGLRDVPSLCPPRLGSAYYCFYGLLPGGWEREGRVENEEEEDKGHIAMAMATKQRASNGPRPPRDASHDAWCGEDSRTLPMERI